MDDNFYRVIRAFDIKEEAGVGLSLRAFLLGVDGNSFIAVFGSAAVLERAVFSISRRGSMRIGSSFPYHVSSSLFAIVYTSVCC